MLFYCPLVVKVPLGNKVIYSLSTGVGIFEPSQVAPFHIAGLT